MRLLHLEDDGQIRLTEFSTDPPPYAILSHTWGPDSEEVTFQDMSQGANTSKPGYDKIRRCGEQAASNGLEYFWVDSCCIDKSSSAELSEAINSMFRYYQDAEICYAYLADVESHPLDLEQFTNSRWLTRGWTLQELIAPEKVLFFGKDWSYIGHRISFAKALERVTGISFSVLVGEQELADTSVATRMSWAAKRQTKRPEDMAYCMLGIFQVNMPLLYGEGTRAFRRLQEEILKHSNDLTIFAWSIPDNCADKYPGLFAPNSASFSNSRGIVPFDDDNASYSVTNKGLRLSGDVPLRVVRLLEGSHAHSEDLYLLNLGTNVERSYIATRADDGIYLRKIGPGLFCRVGGLPLSSSSAYKQLNLLDFTEMYIVVDPRPAITSMASSFRTHAIHVPLNDFFELQEVIPQNLWDVTDRMFLRPKTYGWVRYPSVLIMRFRIKIAESAVKTPTELIVFCDYREEPPKLRVLNKEKHTQEAATILHRRYKENSLSWEELHMLFPEVRWLNNSTKIKDAGGRTVSVSTEKRTMRNYNDVSVLKFALLRK